MVEDSIKLALLDRLLNLPDLFVILHDRQLRYMNPSALKALGYSEEEIPKLTLWEIVAEDSQKQLKRYLADSLLKSSNPTPCSVNLKRKDGSTLNLLCYGSLIKSTPAKCLLVAGIVNRAQGKTDPVTSLPNEHMFMEKAEKLLKFSKRKQEMVAIAIIDIKNFSSINATYGRRDGDLILKSVAEKLTQHLRESDLIARGKGDRFLIAFTGIRELHSIYKLINKTRTIFKNIPFKNRGLYLDVNIGMSVFPTDGSDIESLIEKAELALHKCKAIGGQFTLFSEELKRELINKLLMKDSLLMAMHREEIILHYQPIFELRGLKIVGAEALARWNHPKRGLLSPSTFIPLAEETKLIIPLGYYIVEQAFKNMKRLGRKKFFISINFSPKQFFDENLPEILNLQAEKYNIDPQNIFIEITETTAMKSPEKATSIINRLKNLGFRICIDDFGKGYSSLNYLLHFDVDKIKVDREFIVRLPDNEKVKHITKAIVGLAGSLNARSVAEGIESKFLLEGSKNLGFDEAQGFYLSHPMDINTLQSCLTTL